MITKLTEFRTNSPGGGNVSYGVAESCRVKATEEKSPHLATCDVARHARPAAHERREPSQFLSIASAIGIHATARIF